MTKQLEIVIAAGGMEFGPDTLKFKSLGGSETAALSVAKALRKRGHLVRIFAPLPPPGRPDHVPNNHADDDGLRWMHLNDLPEWISVHETDLFVASRQPEFLNFPVQAKKTVLWCHDLATHEGIGTSIMNVAWQLNEVWTVSEWHRQQWAKITGYPLQRIKATRNGISPQEVMDFGKVPGQLLYAARPERGLVHLVKPGGIMSKLPEYTLKIAMYDNYPQHMVQFYNQLFGWAKDLPNVEVLGPKTQQELRQLMNSSEAYVYPTEFEEVSCIIARECIEQKLPFITTAKGALPETLADCGIYLPDDKVGSPDWIDRFCREVRSLRVEAIRQPLVEAMSRRKDLYWDEVAQQWEEWAEPAPSSVFSRAWSLLEDSDVIPAIHLLNAYPMEQGQGVQWLRKQIEDFYPHVLGRESFESYYERYYRDLEDPKGSRQKPDNVAGTPRYQAIAQEVAKLKPGSRVLDYGCAEGVIVNNLAKQFPNLNFVGVDFAKTNVELAAKFAAEDGSKNVWHFHGSLEAWPAEIAGDEFDAVICSEVLEHVMEPWLVAFELELKVKKGGRFISTVPSGPWEASGLYNVQHWPWRAHIWHINKWMLRKMFADKKNRALNYIHSGRVQDARQMGHLVMAYEVDHEQVHWIDPLEKAAEHRSRQTVGAAIIAKDSAEALLRMLNSINRNVQQVHFAVGPCKDDTLGVIERWSRDNPWHQVTVHRVPSVEPKLFGFDDARNVSMADLNTDWVLWMDTDEYLSNWISPYARDNAFDSYAIHQHHFTCDPRGAAPQLDKPARLFRRDGQFKFFGKVHEHAEKGFNGGPGFCFILPTVDIGHIGYVNEEVRRARFSRNFPLLVWDREVNPERKLGHFLWLRDILHRLRWFVEQRDLDRARLCAEEAVDFYRRQWADNFDMSGMGGIHALTYYSEALAFLGRGVPVSLSYKVEDKPEVYQLQGIFETPEEAAKALAIALKGQFDRLTSRYRR